MREGGGLPGHTLTVVICIVRGHQRTDLPGQWSPKRRA